ncbi:MAG: hypothetical protein KDA38_15940 [Planctomycetales bacterium]|nr:hypothetical protein [Planctomycetales bacterium]
MSDERSSRRSAAGGRSAVIAAIVVFVLFVMPMLYVLSIGPVVYFYQDSEPPMWLQNFYAPILWVHGLGGFVGQALERYAEMWRG